MTNKMTKTPCAISLSLSLSSLLLLLLTLTLTEQRIDAVTVVVADTDAFAVNNSRDGTK